MVAPVRWATPGTEVDCAIQFWLSASATIQSTSTPPPWPPIASTAMQSGRVWSMADGFSMMFIVLSNQRKATPVAAALQETNDAATQFCHELIEAGRVIND